MPGGKGRRVPERYMRAEFGRPGPRLFQRNRRMPENPRGLLIPQADIGWIVNQYGPPVLKRNIEFIIDHGDLRDLDIRLGFEHQIILIQNHLAEQDNIVVQRQRLEDQDYERWKKERDARLMAEAEAEDEAEQEENKEKE